MCQYPPWQLGLPLIHVLPLSLAVLIDNPDSKSLPWSTKMAPNTRQNREARHTRLLKKWNYFKAQFKYAARFKEAAQLVLQTNEIGSEGQAADISASIVSMLPPPALVFTQDYFEGPSYPTLILKDAADLYRCLPIPEHIKANLDNQT